MNNNIMKKQIIAFDGFSELFDCVATGGKRLERIPYTYV